MSAKGKLGPTELRPTNRRLESFSDGVFAIVITIMVLEVEIPDSLAFASDPAELRAFGSAVIAYALSFLIIANLWISHHYLIFTLDMPARSTIWLNNLLLFTISLIPVTTRFLGAFPTSPRAAAAYGTIGMACTGAFMLLRSHAARMTRNPLHKEIHSRVLRLSWLFISIYAVSIPLAFVSPWLAWLCFIIVPPMLFLPIIRASMAPLSSAEEHRALEHSCP
jgi:uncharacterized membrane protein